MNLYGTCVAIDGHGVLLRGPSGSGKSDLALRLIDQYADTRLVSDDRVDVAHRDGALYATAPAAIAARMEVRGVGVVPVDYAGAARLDLLVDLSEAAAIERFPEPAFEEILGVRLPRLLLAPFLASAPAKLRQAVRMLNQAERETQ